MRISRIVGVVALVLAMFATFPTATAASCLQSTVTERAAQAEVVVYGTVTETRQTLAAASGLIRFQPVRSLKGTLPGDAEVYLGPSRGGAISSVDYQAAERGHAHTLYLRSAGNRTWETHACSGSHEG